MSGYCDEAPRRSVCCFDPDEGRRTSTRRKRANSKRTSQESEEKKPCFSVLVHLCSVRDRSSFELTDKLLQQGYDPDEVEAAVNRALECNLVNNERFADAFIRTKVSAGKGRVWIQRELLKLGIDAESLPLWPDEYGLCDGDQEECAISFLRTHPPRCKDLYAGAYRKLVQRGYSCQTANQAARSWMQEIGEWR